MTLIPRRSAASVKCILHWYPWSPSDQACPCGRKPPRAAADSDDPLLYRIVLPIRPLCLPQACARARRKLPCWSSSRRRQPGASGRRWIHHDPEHTASHWSSGGRRHPRYHGRNRPPGFRL